MRADFRDLRASTGNGTKIRYFTETVTAFNQTFVWFKLPAGTSSFYIHYGNGGVVSESDGKKVFTFFDHFDKLDPLVWQILHGSGTVSGSVLTVQHSTLNSIVESVQKFGVNTIVESRLSHALGNVAIFGYRNTDTQKSVAWQGATSGTNLDHRFSHNGTSGTWNSDGVTRGGSTYYVYGTAHIAGGPLYYVNYAYRGVVTANIPGNVSLPISFYSTANKGAVKVDWVRVRDYVETMPTLSIGRKYTTQPKGYPWDNAISAVNTRMGMHPTASIKSFFKDIKTTMGAKTSVMFRRPMFYNPQLRGPYPNWKYAGEIALSEGNKNDPVLIDDCNSITNWGYAYASTCRGIVSVDNDNFISSPGSMKLNVTVGGGTLALYRSVSLDLTGVDFIDYMIRGPAGSYGVMTLWCADNSNIYNTKDFLFTGDWQYIRTYISDMVVVGSPDISKVTSVRFGLRNSIEGQVINVDNVYYGTNKTVKRIQLPLLPGMTVDGRDLRITDMRDQATRFNIFNDGFFYKMDAKNYSTVLYDGSSLGGWSNSYGTVNSISTETGMVKVVGTTDAAGRLQFSKVFNTFGLNTNFVSIYMKCDINAKIRCSLKTDAQNYATWENDTRYTLEPNTDTTFIFQSRSASSGKTSYTPTAFYQIYDPSNINSITLGIGDSNLPNTAVTFYFKDIIASKSIPKTLNNYDNLAGWSRYTGTVNSISTENGMTKFVGTTDETGKLVFSKTISAFGPDINFVSMYMESNLDAKIRFSLKTAGSDFITWEANQRFKVYKGIKSVLKFPTRFTNSGNAGLYPTGVFNLYDPMNIQTIVIGISDPSIPNTDITFYVSDIIGDFAVDECLDCWVEIPTGASALKLYYGNGLAKTVSDSTVEGIPKTESITLTEPNIGGGGDAWPMPGWKYQAEVNLSGTSSIAGGEQISLDIPLLPGMTVDGRDIRFLDRDGNQLSHYRMSSNASGFTYWVRLPANHDKIFLFYGNGLAVSKSSAADTFDFYDVFDSLNANEWNVLGGTVAVLNSSLVLGSATANSIARCNSTFGPGTILEFRMYHPDQNASICGYWSSANMRACWLGANGANYNDFVHTYNGSANTSVDDTINRGGTTPYTYGISYESDSIGFYINYVLRRTVTTTPPSGNIPIAFFSTVNKGDVVIDWVRVRKTTAITGVIGRRKSRSGPVYYETVTQTTAEIIPTVEISHRPQWKTPQIYYDYIQTPSSYMGAVLSEPTFKVRRDLADYAISSCEVSRSINDAYIQLSTEFHNLMVPPEGSTVKHNATDSAGVPHLIFHGKVITNSPVHGLYKQTVRMQAADNSINLVTQPVPWNYQVIDTAADTITTWINRLLEPEKTGVYPNTIIDITKGPRQFVFDPKTKRLEAIKKIAEYAGCMYHTRLVSREIDGYTITRPEFYFVPPERVDEPVNGFDLPDPLILDIDDCKLTSDPQVTHETEEKYNSVLVYGVLSENGKTTVASASAYEVYTGDHKPKVYTIEDNTITEKGSTAEREAIKWLLYFLSKRVKVSMSFVDRFDMELYQRIRFGPGFSSALQGLTSSSQVQYIAACDPTDAQNTTHLIDVSGVPRPRWLRISEIKQTSEHKLEMMNITAITDNIYSVVDPVVQAPWSDYVSPGYYKPIIDDLVDTTQSIVEDNIAKQLTPESCTVLSINETEKTAVVQTASGKIVTVSLA